MFIGVVMYSFIVDNKGENDSSVTGTYMNIVKHACSLTGDTNTVANGEKPCDKSEYIVSDTILTAFRYFIYGYKNQIVWMQGVVPEESYMRRHSKFRFTILNYMEKFVLKKSKLLLLVSEDMLKHYEEKYKIPLKDKSIIMPCFNETEIVEDSFFDDKYKKNTFLYVGGMAKWQCFEQMAELYSKIENATDGNTMFYVYTFDKDTAESIIKSFNIKNYKVDYAPKEELSKKIKGMKYGFVLRDDCTVNNVATPTKFSNYLANGIIPIFSNSLRSFFNLDNEIKMGIVCNLDDLDAGATRILEHMKLSVSHDEIKKKCQSVFDTYYNQDIYVETIKKKLVTMVSEDKT